MKLDEKDYTIDVTGHSKGGNKAQFVTINCDIVNECYLFDGQGFSKEALDKDLDTYKSIAGIYLANEYTKIAYEKWKLQHTIIAKNQLKKK